MERTEADGLIRCYRRARWATILGLWGAIYVFYAARHTYDAYLANEGPSPAWLRLTAVNVAMWAAVTPFMMWMGRRVPLDRDRRPHHVAVHVAALLGIIALDAALQMYMWRDHGTSGYPAYMLASSAFDAITYAAAVAISHVKRANALYRERELAQAALDRELTTARLRALEAQLQPHFLFNTLHAVGALVRSARPDDAVRSLATLGGLLRASLAGDDQHELPLDDELALAERYLELQQLRFADRLRVELDIDPAVARARVPRLILQPLLENAVRHGVERSRAAVAITVRARAVADQLELVVRDDGGDRVAAAPGHGIGLANTRARLAALYGDRHTLSLTATPGGGLAVRILLPLITAPAPAARSLELEAVS